MSQIPYVTVENIERCLSVLETNDLYVILRLSDEFMPIDWAWPSWMRTFDGLEETAERLADNGIIEGKDEVRLTCLGTVLRDYILGVM